MSHYRHFKHLHVPEQWEQYWSKYPNGYTVLEALINWTGQVNDMVDSQNHVSDQMTALQIDYTALEKELRMSWNAYKEHNTKTYSDFTKEIYTIINNWIATIEPTIQDETVKNLKKWLDDGTLADIINIDVFNMKANQTDLDEVTTQLAQMVHVTHVIKNNDGERNLTDELQALLNANVGKIIYWDNVGKPYKTRQLNVPSNTHIVFHPLTEIRATEGYGTNEEVFRILNKDNVVFDGNYAEIAMNKPEYTTGEWRHCMSIFGSRNVTIKNLKLNDSGGDGLIVGGSLGGNIPSEHIVVEGCTFDNNRRQGLSIVGGAYHVVVRDSHFSNTTGTLPMFGIDIEPNPNELDNRQILVENCSFDNNQGGAVGIYDNSFDVTIRNIKDFSGDQYIMVKRMNATRKHPTVTIENSSFSYLAIDSVNNVVVKDSVMGRIISEGAVSDYEKLSLVNCLIDATLVGGAGSYISKCSDVKVENTTFSSASGIGLSLENSKNSIIKQSTFKNHTSYPLKIAGSPNTKLLENTFRKVDKETTNAIFLEGGNNIGVIILNNDFTAACTSNPVKADAETFVQGINKMVDGKQRYFTLGWLVEASHYWVGFKMIRNLSGVYQLHECVQTGADTYAWVNIHQPSA